MLEALTTSLLLVAALQDPAQNERARTWPVGFRAVRSEEVPRGSWIDCLRRARSYVVEESSQEIEIRFDHSDGYVRARVRIWLRPDGAHASASYHDCTSAWHGESVAGSTCLVSDGRTATLQFELYEGGSESIGMALRGQVELGAVGAEWSTREPKADEKRVRFEYTCPGGYRHRDKGPTTFEASGRLDGYGRRQGLWIVTETSSPQPRFEQMWRDGIPDGIFRQLKGESDFLRIGQLLGGFQEGQEITWLPNGARHVSEHRHGQFLGSTSYGPDGEPLRESEPLATPSPAMKERWERISALHTRR